MSVANYDKLNPHILEEKKVESTFQLHFQGKRFPEWKILYLIKFKLSTVQLFLQELTDWHCCISPESVKIIDLPPGIYNLGQNEKEQQAPIPHKSSRTKGKTHYFPIFDLGEGGLNFQFILSKTVAMSRVDL